MWTWSTQSLEGDHRHVRLYLSELGVSRKAQASTHRAARRECLVLQRIDPDHYTAQYGDGLVVGTRLNMIRQLTGAVAAHCRHLYQRALAARSVHVAFHGTDPEPALKIIDCQPRPIRGTGGAGTQVPALA